MKAGTPAGRRRGAWLLAAVLLLAAAGLAWRLQPVAVEAIAVRTQPLQRTLLFSARVETPARVEIGATVTGRVARVLVREGDEVAAGAPLVALEAEEQRAALAQAQASLAQAQARLAAQQAVSRPSADAALAQAEASLRAAERELQRTRELLAAGFISSARLDEAQRALDIARAQRDAARVQARAQRNEGAEAAAAHAQLQLAQAALEAARARLDQHTLRAPAPGRVIARGVEPGQIVQPGRALLTLAVQGPTELVAQVDERFLAQLEPGQRARVLADAYPGRPFEARLLRLAPGVDAQRGAVEVVFAPEGAAPGFLREDMTLSVEVVTGEREAALVLPLRALRDAGPAGDDRHGSAGPATVLVAEDGRARLREVRLGLRTLDQVEITAGLSDGEAVLLAPALEPGTRVKARPIDAARALLPAAPGRDGDGVGGAMSSGFGR